MLTGCMCLKSAWSMTYIRVYRFLNKKKNAGRDFGHLDWMIGYLDCYGMLFWLKIMWHMNKKKYYYVHGFIYIFCNSPFWFHGDFKESIDSHTCIFVKPGETFLVRKLILWVYHPSWSLCPTVTEGMIQWISMEEWKMQRERQKYNFTWWFCTFWCWNLLSRMTFFSFSQA